MSKRKPEPTNDEGILEFTFTDDPTLPETPSGSRTPDEQMVLLGRLDVDIVQDQQGRWWACDGGHSYKDCEYNTFVQCSEDGTPLRGDQEVIMDFVILSEEATFDLEVLRALVGK